MTLESFSCVFCQSKEFEHVYDWPKHSLQAIVVYVKYPFMFQNDYERLGHSVICSIDYYCCMSIKHSNDMNQKWASIIRYELDSIHNRWESQWMFCSYYHSYVYCSSHLVLAFGVLLKKNILKSILCSSLTTFVSSIRNIIMITLLIWTIALSNHCCCVYCQNYLFQPKFGS
jgi:organic radical activating enzyme